MLPPQFRTRSRGSFVSDAISSQQSIWSSCAQSTWTTIGTQPLFATGSIETMTDCVVPGFRRRVANGEVFFNHMRKTTTSAERIEGSGPNRRRTDYFQDCSGVNRYVAYRDVGNQVENIYSVLIGQPLTVGRLPPLGSLLSGSEINDLLLQTSTSVLNDRGRSDSNLWETLAETDKSLRLLSDTFGALNKAVTRHSLRSKTKAFASLWLMYRYAYRPLILDTVEIVKGIQKKVGTVRKTSRGRNMIERSSSRLLTYTDSAMIVGINERTTDKFEIRAMSLDEYAASMSSNIGLSAKGLITLPWELIPYSFVVDWFANIGDFIGAVVPALGWKQLGACTVSTRTRELRIDAISTSPGTNYVIDAPCTGGFVYKVTEKQRVPSLPGPSIVIKSDFRFSNLNRCLDSLGLLLQKIK